MLPHLPLLIIILSGTSPFSMNIDQNILEVTPIEDSSTVFVEVNEDCDPCTLFRRNMNVELDKFCYDSINNFEI